MAVGVLCCRRVLVRVRQKVGGSAALSSCQKIGENGASVPLWTGKLTQEWLWAVSLWGEATGEGGNQGRNNTLPFLCSLAFALARFGRT